MPYITKDDIWGRVSLGPLRFNVQFDIERSWQIATNDDKKRSMNFQISLILNETLHYDKILKMSDAVKVLTNWEYFKGNYGNDEVQMHDVITKHLGLVW